MLRILSLNLWGGQALLPLLDFVREHAPQVDLFCFQEVMASPSPEELACGFRTTMLGELQALLPEFDVAFDTIVCWPEGISGRNTRPVPFGLGTFTRRTRSVASRAAVRILQHLDILDAVPGEHISTRWLQTTVLDFAAGPLLVANYHGVARPGTKRDTAERLEQSRAVRRVLDAHDGPKVLVGDFNLLPETESIQILAAGMRNLVIERAIPTTRSRLNPWYGTPDEQPHADYAFVSPGVPVAEFTVPDVEISDHLPMILTLDL